MSDALFEDTVATVKLHPFFMFGLGLSVTLMLARVEYEPEAARHKFLFELFQSALLVNAVTVLVPRNIWHPDSNERAYAFADSMPVLKSVCVVYFPLAPLIVK
jgi:hypothetical protein